MQNEIYFLSTNPASDIFCWRFKPQRSKLTVYCKDGTFFASGYTLSQFRSQIALKREKAREVTLGELKDAAGFMFAAAIRSFI